MLKHQAFFDQNQDFEICGKCQESKPRHEKNLGLRDEERNKKYKTLRHGKNMMQF